MLSLLELGEMYNKETEKIFVRIRSNILAPLFQESLSDQKENIKNLDKIMEINQTLNHIIFYNSNDICNLKELSEKR